MMNYIVVADALMLGTLGPLWHARTTPFQATGDLRVYLLFE
jgi:hypothetical protein